MNRTAHFKNESVIALGAFLKLAAINAAGFVSLCLFALLMTGFIYVYTALFFDMPVVYWSHSKQSCVKVMVKGECMECSEFDFENAKYETVYVE